ncbi:hypothetical protein PLUA15_510107 [Pseudomonas lundensis]|uniref:Uncharacterized protein n=1 Tax=Pseudomonas lundensis TaxID=86185 RepID=A0AAX2HDR2_9PSED|nr:hypothetical protein PLUA15_510107 [Pseudomonas lundensis]
MNRAKNPGHLGRHYARNSPPFAQTLVLLGRTDFNDWTEGQQGTSKALYVEKKLGESWIADISTRGIGLFPTLQLKQGPRQKTVNDIFTVVRHIGASAFGDRTLRSAPCGQHQSCGY